MTRDRRGNTSRATKMSIGGRCSTSRVNMPTVIISITSSQQGGISSSNGPDHIIQVQTLDPTIFPHVQISNHGSTPSVHLETYRVIPNRSNTIGEGASTDQRNIIGNSISSQNKKIGNNESNSNSGQRTSVFLSIVGLVCACTIIIFIL